MINSTNIITPQQINLPPLQTKKQAQQNSNQNSNLIKNYLDNLALINTPAVNIPQYQPLSDYHNNLRTMFKNNEAKILAIIPRTFNARDLNHNEYIEDNEQHGTFLNAIKRLDEVKKDGFNAIHLLPINEPGKLKAMGTAGSLYSPKDMLEIDPTLVDPTDPRPPKQQFKALIDECHKRGIKVILDMPSCASYDMFLTKPELMAKEADGLAKTPQGWNDIRMFQPWVDANKRILNPALIDLHKKYVNLCSELGVDGIRADVARAKPTEFWDIIIPYSRKLNPEFGWLAETYTYEDASPQANMPYDRPDDLLRAGFDCIYGQYHIFNEWSTASEFTNYITDNLKNSYNLPKGKSMIGSFATHDDISPMFHGGVDYCNLTMVLQSTLPMINPYIVDGYQSGDYYMYPYEDKKITSSDNDNNIMDVHRGKLDIFNLSRKPQGSNPEIGKYMTKCFKMRDKYADIIEHGTFIPLEKEKDDNDQIIAYLRHYKGKTLLVVANKNVNRSVAAKIKIPTLKKDQALLNLVPSYGKESIMQTEDNELDVDLGAARAHVFEINTPDIENYVNKIYKQNS